MLQILDRISDLGFMLDLRTLNSLNTVGAFLHDTTHPNRHIRILGKLD